MPVLREKPIQFVFGPETGTGTSLVVGATPSGLGMEDVCLPIVYTYNINAGLLRKCEVLTSTGSDLPLAAARQLLPDGSCMPPMWHCLVQCYTQLT